MLLLSFSPGACTARSVLTLTDRIMGISKRLEQLDKLNLNAPERPPNNHAKAIVAPFVNNEKHSGP